ncbi:cytochrome P450 [Anaerocolumna sp. MB42-C2]|uniref:cytochrome P450 n=1 Tax=Anaerocolumna sp. MB42-C2 TaxID=3070997 RepID=UPI0027E026ED|nr:cytochrome P450 [Anaerocolumna sp. MB42-C2]WMJ88809.1 cytochrome P450 [Anaerocolumna sp. MB42-C2]
MNVMGKVPKDKTLDNSMALLMEGYEFIPNRCRKYHSDIFITRLLGEKVICISGVEAAKIFYDNQKFTRTGAAPKRVQKTLFGVNGVQALDGNAHKHRKAMFMSIMTPYNLSQLEAITNKHWESAGKEWERKTKSRNKSFLNPKQIILFDEVQNIMCKIACEWAGVPLSAKEVKQRADDLGKLIDGFGGIGVRYYEGLCARKRTESWIKGIIMQIRQGKIEAAKNTAAYTIARHRSLNGKLLNIQVAAVELINIIRPIVAIATYVAFGAVAMYEHPDCRIKLAKNENNYNLMFAQEVRRYFPFTPFVGARVRNDFVWSNCLFKRGTLVLLDVYGIDHDSRLWRKPYEFQPERFRKWGGNPYSFIPQGGGDYYDGHRCPGEMVVIEIMKASLGYMANKINYNVPRQNLTYSLKRIPTLPKSRFVINKVRRIK